MYDFLRGQIDRYGNGEAVLDVNGVGYLLKISAMTERDLPEPGETAKLPVDLHYKQDEPVLFGFRDYNERSWFRVLTTIQDVGPQLALSLLSVLPPDALKDALAAGDVERVKTAKNMGAKKARRIIAELGGVTPTDTDSGGRPVQPSSTADKAVSILVKWQIETAEARRRVQQVLQANPEAAVGQIVTEALNPEKEAA